MSSLRRDFLPDDLIGEQRPLGFEGSVVVQARQTLAETEWLLGLAEQNRHILGVVGWADLRSPDLPAQLARFTQSPTLRGVRHVIQDEPDDEFMLHPDFLRGIGQLARWGLTYDILIHPHHLRAAYALARRFPDQAFVLDHVAKPPIRSEELEPWATDVARLAGLPNMYCKLSGLVTEADWGRWKPEGFRPYLDVAFEAFGPERLMIGSDWPVCTLVAPYKEVMAIVIDYVRCCSAKEQRMILGESAQSFYGLTRQTESS
jgi:L-fuconolactonase